MNSRFLENALFALRNIFRQRARAVANLLAIALGVVRAHGGTIEVNSRPGEGAEFIMRLPAGDGPQTPNA